MSSVQTALPGLRAGLAARDEGIARVTINNLNFIIAARGEATRRARFYGSVTSDDLREWAARLNWQPAHPNAWGAIFRGKEWVAVGRVQSRTPSCHARWIHEWALAAPKKPDASPEPTPSPQPPPEKPPTPPTDPED